MPEARNRFYYLLRRNFEIRIDNKQRAQSILQRCENKHPLSETAVEVLENVEKLKALYKCIETGVDESNELEVENSINELLRFFNTL